MPKQRVISNKARNLTIPKTNKTPRLVQDDKTIIYFLMSKS